MMPVEFFIALRYLKARKKGFFSLLTTFIAIGSTTLGVSALVITLAIMSGFQNDIRSKILGIQSHIVVTRIDGESFKDYISIENKIKTNKSVISASPFIYKQGVIRGLESASSTGIIIKAIDYAKENAVLNLSKQITISDMGFDDKKIGERAIILGSELAKSVDASAGDQVILMFPGSFGNIPKMYKFTVAALIQSGMYDFDSSLGFIDLDEGQKLFAIPEAATGIDVHTNNFDTAVTTAGQLQKKISYPYRAKAWVEMSKNLLSALKLEKIMMFIILGLIILVAASNIISNLLLLSVQKSKEIGIMSAMGFTKFSIAKVFFYEGLVVGLIGTILGIVLGLAVSAVLKYFDIFKLPQGVYYVDKLPVAIIPTDIAMVALSAFIITMIAGIYPAYQVSKLDPFEAIRYG
ncbi:MAG: ABC transporter permease [Endomicrobium sp.]|uniref:FtsX-like permease family protein n=1 Tax=Candidatus Endomicrobiellum pyrsonymphae TaxID=1408203 RepID=UPI003585C0B0|nr:ABC transporter permease [Endomicrobium sp.]